MMSLTSFVSERPVNKCVLSEEREALSPQWTFQVESAWHMPLVFSSVIVVSARPPQLPSHHRLSLWLVNTATFWPLADGHPPAPTFFTCCTAIWPTWKVTACHGGCICLFLHECCSGQGEKSCRGSFFGCLFVWISSVTSVLIQILN